MDTLADIRRRLRTLPPPIYERMERLAKRSGVPLPTIIKIRNGQTTSPRYATVDRLARKLDALE